MLKLLHKIKTIFFLSLDPTANALITYPTANALIIQIDVGMKVKKLVRNEECLIVL